MPKRTEILLLMLIILYCHVGILVSTYCFDLTRYQGCLYQKELLILVLMWKDIKENKDTALVEVHEGLLITMAPPLSVYEVLDMKSCTKYHAPLLLQKVLKS